MKQLKVNFFQTVLLTLFIAYLGAQRLHETGHWVFSQIFHRAPTVGFLGLVQTGVKPDNLNGWQTYIDPIGGETIWLRMNSLPQSNFEWATWMMMGQIFQILIILVGLFLIYRNKNILIKYLALIVIFINSFFQLFYLTLKLINATGGDEYFAAFFLGVNPRIITGILALFYCGVLLLIFYKIDGWGERIKLLIAGILSFGLGPILGIFDGWIRQQILLNKPIVQPIFGFSIPVLVVDFIVLIAFLFLVNKINKKLITKNGVQHAI